MTNIEEDKKRYTLLQSEFPEEEHSRIEEAIALTDTLEEAREYIKTGNISIIEVLEESVRVFSDASINFTFWFETGKKKKSSGELKISHERLNEFLVESGFRNLQLDTEDRRKRTLIHIDGQEVEEVDLPFVRNFTYRYIQSLPDMITENFSRQDLLEKFTSGIDKYLNSCKIDLLPNVKLDFLRDEETKMYFSYLNGIVCVEKERISIIPYSDQEKYIWKNHKIKRNYVPMPFESFDFTIFCSNVCTNRETGLGEKRLISLKCLLGYLMHTWKCSASLFAPMFMEASLEDDPHGRTGKGLLMRAVGLMRKMLILDGKNFNSDSQFSFQNYSLDVQIILLNDMLANFRFESLFSIITDGLNFEEKNKKRVILSPEESPKIAITTNYSVRGESESDRDRKFEMELECYYSSSYKPLDDFEKRFFDWNEEEWNKFYSFMLHCCQLYLQLHVQYRPPEYSTQTLGLKKLITQTSKDFVDFMSVYMIENESKLSSDGVQCDSFYRDFCRYIEQDQDDKSKEAVTKTKIGKWKKIYSKLNGYKLTEKVQSAAGKTARFFWLEKIKIEE